ncbi:membrane protein insertase YidC [Corynebacterium liangguodongii]|uniref:Membrane protein insertase YidC n=1 Tax=Corynebacterium liangguodongii TaxID=2079535 RepID=A0A2S0WGS9_9CORY|nr:membrane protein insertase YidC [Corynebacterium liangguodongii]AWB84882.1 membrane protein insertase YidC [Corynebacterium liangguodongii]PWB99238.1 membrane protein insertase YidC [Corynebacterium liangguodongii]
MIELFVYPVSAVMKFWHWLLADVLSVESSHSWVASVVLLVVTVRGLIAPLQWYSYKTSRLLVLMRPHLAEIESRYGQGTTVEAVRGKEQATKELHERYQYNPFAGCMPVLIQLPFFLGLYRLLLWMAVPESSSGRALGVLAPAEVESFRASTFAGVPLPAYMSMNAEQFAHLGTTRGDVSGLAIPMLIAAAFFTTLNLVISQIRMRSTLEWGNPASQRVYCFVWCLVPIVPAGITLAGLTGLVPVALLLYWVSGNFWTIVQNITLWVLTVRAFPLEDHHREHMRQAKEAEMSKRRSRHEWKRSRRRRRAGALVKPWTIASVRRDLAAEKAAAGAARAEEKAEKKRIAAQRRAAVRESNQLRREEARRKASEKARAQQQEKEPEPEPEERGGEEA